MEISPAASLFRASSPLAATSSLSSSARWCGRVPSDQFLSLPANSPRAPHPPVAPYAGTHVLSAGLGSSGIYTAASMDAAARANGWEEEKESTKPQRSYWKSALTLAHQPPPININGGAQTARGDTDTATQLFRTYRKHLAY